MSLPDCGCSQLSKSAEFPGSAAVGELMRELALGYSVDHSTISRTAAEVKILLGGVVVWHMDEARFQRFERDVALRTNSGAADGHISGMALGVGDQISQRSRRKCRIADQRRA
jgi:hypothetical protein